MACISVPVLSSQPRRPNLAACLRTAPPPAATSTSSAPTRTRSAPSTTTAATAGGTWLTRTRPSASGGRLHSAGANYCTYNSYRIHCTVRVNGINVIRLSHRICYTTAVGTDFAVSGRYDLLSQSTRTKFIIRDFVENVWYMWYVYYSYFLIGKTNGAFNGVRKILFCGTYVVQFSVRVGTVSRITGTLYDNTLLL